MIEITAPAAPPIAAPAPEEDQQVILARDAVYRWLAMRAHSRGELTAKLARKGYPEEVIEIILNRFAKAGLIDDEAFASEWVRSRHLYSGKGRGVLRQELRTKGVAEITAAAALEQISDEDERGRATELVQRKLARTDVPSDRADREKLMARLVAMLARRGFGGGLAYSIVRDAVSARSDEQRAGE